MNKNIFSAILVSLFIVGVPNANALDLPIPWKSKKGDAGVDVNPLTKQQGELVALLNESLRNLAESQKLMADALGLKAQAATAEANANKLKIGDLTGKDDIDKALSSTLSVNNEIDAELKKGAKLSEESKAKFKASLPAYGTGAAAAVLTGKRAADAANSLIATADFTILNKLGNLIYIGKKSPTLISTFTKSTGHIISFSKSNGVDSSELEKLTQNW